MRKFIAALICIIAAPVYGQIIEDGTYFIDAIISEQGKEYTVTQRPADRKYTYGNHVTFDSVAGTFHSFYTAPCGNDCFPESKGRYEVIDEGRIRLHLSETSEHGFCGTGEREVTRQHDLDLGIFTIHPHEKGYILR